VQEFDLGKGVRTNRESISETGCNCTQGTVTHSTKPCPQRLKEIVQSLSRAEMAWWGKGGDELFDIWWSKCHGGTDGTEEKLWIQKTL